MVDNYERNKNLIDLSYIPSDIESKIIDEYVSLNNQDKQIPIEYFKQHQLSDLMQDYYFRSNKPTFNHN